MTVIWRSDRGAHWPDAAYAIPCPTCNVEIGQPCDAQGTHLARAERVDVFGFVTDVQPPLLQIMEAAE
jgi:hypothetical protein